MAADYLARSGHHYADALEFGLDLILDGLGHHRNGRRSLPVLADLVAPTADHGSSGSV